MLCLCYNLQFFPLPLSPLGDIPIVPLNFVMISLEGPFSRDIVEGCVKEGRREEGSKGKKEI